MGVVGGMYQRFLLLRRNQIGGIATGWGWGSAEQAILS